MLKCEKCGGIIEDNKIFYDIHDKFYCDCCVEDNKGIFVVKDTQISVDTTHKFFIKNQARKFKSFDECIRNLENDIFLDYQGKIVVKQVNNLISEYYDKREFGDDKTNGITCELNGK